MAKKNMVPEEVILQARNLDRAGTVALLEGYTKSQLLDLAKVADIAAGGTKATVVSQIASHYGYKKLVKKMAERPPMTR